MVLAARKYRAFMGGLIMYAFLIPSVSVFIRQHPESSWQIPLALVTVVPVVFTLSASIRFPDRFSRDQMRPLLLPGTFAFLCTLFLTIAVGLLEFGGLPRMAWLVLPVFMLVFWSLGQFLMLHRAKG